MCLDYSRQNDRQTSICIYSTTRDQVYLSQTGCTLMIQNLFVVLCQVCIEHLHPRCEPKGCEAKFLEKCKTSVSWICANRTTEDRPWKFFRQYMALVSEMHTQKTDTSCGGLAHSVWRLSQRHTQRRQTPADI